MGKIQALMNKLATAKGEAKKCMDDCMKKNDFSDDSNDIVLTYNYDVVVGQCVK